MPSPVGLAAATAAERSRARPPRAPRLVSRTTRSSRSRSFLSRVLSAVASGRTCGALRARECDTTSPLPESLCVPGAFRRGASCSDHREAAPTSLQRQVHAVRTSPAAGSTGNTPSHRNSSRKRSEGPLRRPPKKSLHTNRFSGLKISLSDARILSGHFRDAGVSRRLKFLTCIKVLIDAPVE
jgi:hypothetical protein